MMGGSETEPTTSGSEAAELRAALLALAEADRRLRAELAASGVLFEGYHPAMRRLHEANAERLARIIESTGWPCATLVGVDGAEAAWSIAQHAISRPDFMRRCLELLSAAAAEGRAPALQAAYLEDRIRVMAGRAQRFGTQLDWDERGRITPLPIEGPEQVEERRASVGLPPLEHAIIEHRARAAAAGERPPPDHAARRRAIDEFAASVGWRGACRAP